MMHVEDRREIELTPKEIENIVIEHLKTKGLIKDKDKSVKANFHLTDDPTDDEYSIGGARQVFGGCIVTVIK